MLCRVLLINLIGLGLCSGYNPTLNLNIISGAIFTCEDRNATVLEGEPLEIQVNNLNPSIKQITCRSDDNNETFNTTRSFDSKNISVGNVTPDMGTAWKCTILTLEGLQDQRMRTAKCGSRGKSCAAIDCKIQMHVRRTIAPQVILVNGMVLSSARAALDESHDALAEYTFNDGDLVDVTCANPRGQNCHLRMDYNYSRNFPNISDDIFDRFTSLEPVGFQLRMGAVNDKTYAICMCYIGIDYTSLRVNFLMRSEPIGFWNCYLCGTITDGAANSVNLYINGAALRTLVVPTSAYQAEYEYRYKPNEGREVKCESENGDNVTFEWLEKPKQYQVTRLEREKHSVTILYNPTVYKEEVSFLCFIYQYKIKVKLMPRDLYDTQRTCSLETKLKLRYSLAKTSLDVNKASKRYLIYEYNDGDSFDLTCTANCKEGLLDFTNSGGHIRRSHMDFDTNTSIEILNINKSEIDQDNVYQCKQNVPMDTKLITTIVFVRNVSITSTRKTSVTTTTTTKAKTTKATTTKATTTKATTTKPTAMSTISTTRAMTSPKIETEVASTAEPERKNRLLPVVSSVAGVVVMCVSAVIYKIRNRKNNSNNTQGHPSNGNVNYENLGNGDGSPIPPFPSNWDEMYANPLDQAPESTYSEPCAGPTNIKPELYTLVVPKSRRKQENQEHEPAYVELDEGRPNVQNTSNDYAEIGSVENRDLDCMYSEITPKIQSNNLNAGEYLNVNRENPNYAQVLPKSMRKKREDASKYANVHDGRYVNANTGGEYAEPAYCEPTYLNK